MSGPDFFLSLFPSLAYFRENKIPKTFFLAAFGEAVSVDRAHGLGGTKKCTRNDEMLVTSRTFRFRFSRAGNINVRSLRIADRPRYAAKIHVRLLVHEYGGKIGRERDAEQRARRKRPNNSVGETIASPEDPGAEVDATDVCKCENPGETSGT